MKSFLFLSTLWVMLAFQPSYAQTSPAAGGLTWYTDVIKAQQQSNATRKPIFAFFTGSDWCGWCHKLQKDVFAKPAFIKWAKEKVILLELDFPRRKQLSPELTKQNSELQQAFQVGGYPTIWLFFLKKNDKTGKQDINALGSLGYPEGATRGEEEVKFLEGANKILATKK